MLGKLFISDKTVFHCGKNFFFLATRNVFLKQENILVPRKEILVAIIFFKKIKKTVLSLYQEKIRVKPIFWLEI